MRIMIVGAGQVGYFLCERFSNEGQDVVLIDTNKERLQKIERDLNIMTVHGSGASARILAEAGIAKTQLFIAATDSDEVNLVSCIMSRSYDVETRIARVRNEDFLEQGLLQHEDSLGIDLMISPDQAMCEEIVGLCHVSAAFDMAEFAGGQLMLLGYQISDGNALVGHSLMDLQQRDGSHNFVMTAVIRGSQTIIPRGQDRIEAGDRVYLMLRRSDIPAVERIFHLTSRVPRRVFIIGGGTTGYLVARSLEDLKVDVVLVEKNRERCTYLAENLSRTRVLNCDGLEAHDLLDEGIDRADLVISLTESDTTNLLSSILAKHHGAGKCITKITRHDFVPLLSNLGIDVALSARQVAASMILRYIRRGAIGAVATIMGSDAEAMEIGVPHLRKFDNIPLKELKFPMGAVIGAIVRNRQVLIPSGETLIKSGDNLVVFYVKNAATAVEKLLRPEG
ncbi:MAG: Trk system potassium transporter TrkA [Desulfobulbaceae bacterium]|uniref:Trk system potassium uptake protein TrkA n=1 Tax=Candidatus Desulfatifera sulfidica TaxID=2841691 RepID=A0A8J6NA49_9BACT|nr:Trk system potassium transporter TrkA [Candidatus Desulfatifera sulfidica]